MRVAIDVSPIDKTSKSAHKVRGVGKYIKLLQDNLKRFDEKNDYVFTSYPQRVKADLIHYPYFDPFFITLPYVKKTKTLITVHDVIPLAHKQEFPVGFKGEAKWRVNKFLLKNSDGIITDSIASQEDIQNLLDIPADKICPVYLAVDEIYQRIKVSEIKKSELFKKYSLPEHFVMYVGDITWNKNMPRLVEAIKQTNIPIVIVGKAIAEAGFDMTNPWNKDKVTVMMQTQADQRFFKLGFVPDEDLALLYNLATALVMPSLDEGFGLPVLEAMKSGCPVVTSRLGSLEEVAGEAALYVDAKSVEDITYGIEKIVADNSLRSQCIEKGFLQAKKFTLEKMMRETIKVYEIFSL